MKKSILYLSLAVLVLAACAKTPKKSANESDKLYLESWIQVYHPEATRTSLGAYVLEDIPGTGAAAGSYESNPYIQINYTVRNLDGSVQGTTDMELAQQLGSYDESAYYGPVTWTRASHGLAAGIEESVAAMRVGGRRTVVIPGWLLGVDASSGTPIIYDTAQEYLDKVTGGTPRIYEIELTELIQDVNKWQCDSVGRYVAHEFPGKSVTDSLKYGIYYFRTAEPSSTAKFKNDTTIYINYIGRRLDGAVFDTSIADTAKFYGIYSASRTYGPCAVTWYGSDKTYTDITMKTAGATSASSVINGFAFGLDQMHPHEQGSVIFIAGWGYGSKASGSAIPAYSPLRFDLEIVDKPES